MGITKGIAESIISLISKVANSWWMQIVAIGVVIVGFVLLSMFSENLKKWVVKMRENRAKMKEELKKLQFENDADRIHHFSETISKS